MRVRAGCVVAALLAGSAPARGDDADELRAAAAAVAAVAAAPLASARAPVFPSQDGVGVLVEGDAPAALATAFGEALVEALRGDASRVSRLPASDALPAAARAAGLQRVLRVSLSPEVTGLTASASTLRVRAGAWESFLSELPEAAETPAENVPLALSASLRARFGLPTRPPWPASGVVRHRTIPTPFRSVVALAMGRVDGALALALASTDTLRVARLEARTLSFLPNAWPLAALDSVASPPRQPLGSMTWDAQGIRLRTSAQSHAGLVAAEGEGLSRAIRADGEAWPCADGSTGVDAVTARMLRPRDPAMRAAFPAARGDARVDCDGAGACVVRVGAEVRGTLRDVAPPALIDDLDGDGSPEVLLATASQPDATDRVRVFSVREGGIQERASIPAPGPVLALSTGETPEGRALVIAARDLARGTVTLLLVP